MNYISEYKKFWVEEFKEIARFLEIRLPHGLKIHPVGSTSVPRLPAKDIVGLPIRIAIGRIVSLTQKAEPVDFRHRWQ